MMLLGMLMLVVSLLLCEIIGRIQVNAAYLSSQSASTRHSSGLQQITSMTLTSSNSSPTQAPTQITLSLQVCSNKDCRRNFVSERSITDVIQDLLYDNLLTGGSPVLLETTGCLGQCGQGPNLQQKLDTTRKTDQGVTTMKETLVSYLTRTTDVIDWWLALQQQQASGEDDHSALPKTSTKLIAAVTVLEKGCTAKSFSEKDRFFSSVIKSLGADESLACSAALIHAFLLRATSAVDAAEDISMQRPVAASDNDSQSTLFQRAIQDCEQVITLLENDQERDAVRLSSSQQLRNDLVGKAYRIAAIAYEGNQQCNKAIEAWRRVVKYDPSFQSKVAKEVDRLAKKL